MTDEVMSVASKKVNEGLVMEATVMSLESEMVDESS